MRDTFYREVRRLGGAVRTARKARGFSQEDFAEVAGIHRTYAGAIERGEVNVSWQNISRVARALRLRPSELLRRAGL
jgi:transcriptional regulator with XRE-family HTH domain